MATYNYSISSDFSSSLDMNKLHRQISESGIATSLDGVFNEGDSVDITFTSALSGGDETTLDTLVSNHDGQADSYTTDATLKSTITDSTSTTSYVNLTELELNGLLEGYYKISWHFEVSCSTTQYHADFQILYDSTATVLCENSLIVSDTTRWYGSAGFTFQSLTTGNHIIYFKCKSENASNTVNVKNINIDVRRVGYTEPTITENKEVTKKNTNIHYVAVP